MSLSGTRATIATALTAVDGVKGYAYRPTTARPGDAWPLWSGSDRDNGLAFFVSWRVVVLLPQDERSASDWIDGHVEDLVDALEPLAFVDRIEPIALGADQFALQLTLRSD